MQKTDQLYRKALNFLSVGKENEALVILKSIYESGGSRSELALRHIFHIFSKSENDSGTMGLLEEACQKYPKSDVWPAQLSYVWMRLGQLEKAIEYADKALAINPDKENTFINRVCWLAAQCEDSKRVKELFESWGRRFADPLTDMATALHERNLSRERKLKVGYVSGDLKNHSVRYFIEAFFRGHDRQQIEVNAFMTMAEDLITPILKPMVDRWFDVEKMSDTELLNLIRQEEIDILVDLSGHTIGHRLAVFARRAAPVQVTWFGFMQTLGMKGMDWRLTDWSMCPAGTDEHYCEKLYRLDCMAAYTPPVNSETQYESPHHSNGFVTMVSMNHTRKLTDEVLGAWKDIMLAHPNTALILIGRDKDPEVAKSTLEPRLTSIGFPLDRVLISPRLTMAVYLRLASLADFALDSYPVSGGTTTLHSLWMGLPILAINDPAYGAMGSATANTLQGLNLTECIAESLEEYRTIAGEWIEEPLKIDKLRDRCRPAIAGSALMNHPARVAEVELAYRHMWNAYVDAASTFSGCTN